MDAPPRVPVQIVAGRRVDAALKFAGGIEASDSLGHTLDRVCELLAQVCDAPVASAYVLEGEDELVLRGNHGFPREAIGEVRLKVGQGITGTAVETLRPVTVEDAGLTPRFAYFPQLAEERYPAFLAVPVLTLGRPRGALVLQREAGPFSEADVLLLLACTRTVSRLLEKDQPHGATVQLSGQGNACGRALGMVRILTRALARREARVRLAGAELEAARGKLVAAFDAERDELSELLDRARAEAVHPAKIPHELFTVLHDARLPERALEHLAAGLTPSIALERLASESARMLAAHGPASRRALEVEAFVSGVALRYAGVEDDRLRKGELMTAVHLPGLIALRGWAHGATGALSVSPPEESPGVALLSALGIPAVSGLRALFDRISSGDRVALDADAGVATVNPSAAQAAAARK